MKKRSRTRAFVNALNPRLVHKRKLAVPSNKGNRLESFCNKGIKTKCISVSCSFSVACNHLRKTFEISSLQGKQKKKRSLSLGFVLAKEISYPACRGAWQVAFIAMLKLFVLYGYLCGILLCTSELYDRKIDRKRIRY